MVPNDRADTIIPEIEKRIAKGTKISTDTASIYHSLVARHYWHQTVDHTAKEYVRGDVHTNGLEGFWSQLKRSIKGTHIHVSPKHLPKYLGEFEFRYNLRKHPEMMFDLLLASF